MATEINGIFDRSLFGVSRNGRADKQSATQGFSQIFATLIAKQMREAFQGKDNGPMGTGGGATGDIYGAFLDEAMGNALARSPAFSQINSMIERELGGPGHTADPTRREPSIKGTARGGNPPETLNMASIDELFGRVPAAPITALPVHASEIDLPSDERGPVLLPPGPSATAPILPPPGGSSTEINRLDE